MSRPTAPQPRPANRLSTWQVIAFALPAFMVSIMQGPVGGILSGVYAKFFGVSLSFIGTALLLSRLFDAVTDPLIGILSDRTKTRFGRRKPWIVAGTLLSMLAVYFLFAPPGEVDGTYFLIWYLIAFLAWTMAEIPSSAWFTELTHNTHERAKIITFRTVSALLGALAFAAAPLLPMFSTTEMTPEVLRVAAWAVVIALPIAVAIAVTFVPEGERLDTEDGATVRDIFQALKSNRPFLLLTGMFMLYGLAKGMSETIGFLYLDTYLLIGDKISLLIMPAILLTMVSMPVWLLIIKRFGKRQAWTASSVISLLMVPAITLIEPGPSAFVPYLTLTMLITLAGGAFVVAAPAMMADVVDFGLLKTGKSHAGIYFAVLALLAKANVAVGGAIAFFILDSFGYDATVKSHDASAVFGLNLAFAYIPVLLFIPAIVGIWKFPIDERRQEIVRRRIEARAARAKRDLEAASASAAESDETAAAPGGGE